MNQSDKQNRIDLGTFFISISTAARMGMGQIPFSEDGTPEVNLELARQNIDLLELLEEKTRGNRSQDEDQLVQKLLFEIRMQFVEVQKGRKKS